MSPRVVTALVVAAIVATSLGVGHWWTRPDLFYDHGDGFSAAPVPVAEAALIVPVTYHSRQRDAQVVTFRAAHAHFAENSAAATASFAICRPGPGDDLIGVVKGDLRRWCEVVRPLVPGARMTYSPSERGEYVVMTIRPTRPGRARVDRVDLVYALGWQRLFQRGTDTVAMDAGLRAR